MEFFLKGNGVFSAFKIGDFNKSFAKETKSSRRGENFNRKFASKISNFYEGLLRSALLSKSLILIESLFQLKNLMKKK